MQKITYETKELNKINLKEYKDKFTKGLYYTSYEKIIKILDTKKEDSPKNKNNTISINLKKTMENSQKLLDAIKEQIVLIENEIAKSTAAAKTRCRSAANKIKNFAADFKRNHK